MKVGAVDPSPVDAAALFTYEIDWEGDGVVDDTVVGPADPPVTHIYTSAGDVALTVVAIDKDGAGSVATTIEVTVVPGAPESGGTEPGNAIQVVSGRLPETGAHVAVALAAAAALVAAGGTLGSGDHFARRRRPPVQTLFRRGDHLARRQRSPGGRGR